MWQACFVRDDLLGSALHSRTGYGRLPPTEQRTPVALDTLSKVRSRANIEPCKMLG